MFTGTKEAVSLAELLVNYQRKHNQELDELREELERQFPTKLLNRRRDGFGRNLTNASRRSTVNAEELGRRDDRGYRGRFRGRRFGRYENRGPRRNPNASRKNSLHSESKWI